MLDLGNVDGIGIRWQRACVLRSAAQRLQIMRDGGADGLDAILAGVGAWRCWREYDHAAIGRHPRYSREGRQYA